MWRRGLLYTLLAATVAATATDGATSSTFLVQKTPFEKTACKIARNPGSLDIAGLKLRAQRMSSCACEMAYSLTIFIGALAAYFMAKTAAERLEKFKHLVRMLSVFLVHYSRDLAIAQIPVPLLSVMELLTGPRSSKGQNLGKRPACDIVARQKEAGSDRLITSRYLVNVLAYSEPALRWPTISVLFYNTHNGGSGGVGIFVNLANVVNAYAHRNSGGLDPCGDPFNLRLFWSDTLSLVDIPAGNLAHYQQVYQNAGNYVLQHGRLPGGPQLHILGGDPGDAPEGYDLDVDAIVIDDAAAEADGDGDAFMADAPASAAFDVVSFDGAVVPAADAGVALRDAALERLAAAFLARAALPDLCCFPLEAAPAPSFLVEGVGGHPCATAAFSRPQAPSLVATPSRRRLPKALDALLDKFWLAPPPVLERLASEDVAVARVVDALAGRAARSFTATAALDGDAGARTTLYDARDAGGALSVRDAAPGTVLARSTARAFAGDAPEVVSLLLAHGADVSPDARDASGSYAPLHLSAGALGPSSMETDQPEDATPADGSTDAVDANGAAVPATTTTAASALPPEQKTLYENTLTTLKNIRKNGCAEGGLNTRLNDLAKRLTTPCGKPMGRKAAYMTRRHWKKEPGKKKPAQLFLTDTPFLAALITELEGFLGLEPSTVDEALDDDDDGAEVVPDTSPEAARRMLTVGSLRPCTLPSMPFLKARCADFGVDYSGLSGRDAIKRVLVKRLKEIVAEAGEEISVGARARAAMAAIEAGAEGDGLGASQEEFDRCLTLLMGDDMPPPLTTGDDFFSLLFRGLSPSKPNDASRPQRRRHDAAEKETLLLGVLETLVRFLDIKSVNAIKEVSRVGLAIVPQRKGLTMWVRRLSACNEETDPKSFRTLLTAPFLAVDPNAEEPEVIQKCTEIMLDLIYDSGRRTAIEDAKGRLSTPGEIVRDAAGSAPYARLEFEQLLLKKGDRDAWFEDWENEHLQCTVETQIKAHTLKTLVELHVAKILRGETSHKLDEVVSKPSSKVTVTLGTSLTTWRDASAVLRDCFENPKKTLESGNYGNARKHSTNAARDIITNAKTAIEARLAELTEGYAGEFDEALEFLLERFKPEGEAQVEAAAAWRSWLDDPKHRAAVAQKATGEVKKKPKKRVRH